MGDNIFTDTKVPWGVWIFRLFSKVCGPRNPRIQLQLYRFFILVMTFLSYVCFHMSRKPISVIKSELLKCPDDPEKIAAMAAAGNVVPASSYIAIQQPANQTNCTSFISQMNNTESSEAHQYLGFLDTSFLGAYAVAMFFSGYIAERVNLRYFLALGMVASGLFTVLFGLGKALGIHSIYYYLAMQFLGGAVQSSGWPGVVTVVANWFGKGKKGFIFGVWNAHTSIGNIVGGILAGSFVDTDWGLSFIAPGLIITVMGVLVWFWLPVKPADLGLEPEQQSLPHHHPFNNDVHRHQPQQTILSHQNRRHYNTLSDDSSSNSRSESPLLQSRSAMPVTSSSSGESSPLLSRHSNVEVDQEAALINYDENENQSAAAVNGAPPTHLQPPPTAISQDHHEKAITFLNGWKIPGVAEFALCLFFCKLVSYTFLYWLPSFIHDTGINVTSEDAAYFATLFDVGGILGGVIAGIASDRTGRPATACAVMIILAIPSMFSYNYFGQVCRFDPLHPHSGCYSGHVVLLMVSGLLVNGPYALITTAVSAELGTHKSLKGSSKALATVTSIIDGTGSVGAAIGPYLAGALQGDGESKSNVFYMLMAADVLSLLLLTRLVASEVKKWVADRRRRVRREQDERLEVDT